MLNPGLSVSVRYGSEIELVGIGTLKVIEPVAGFEVVPNPSHGEEPREIWLGLNPARDCYHIYDSAESPAWIVRPASFCGSGVDLVMVGPDYLQNVLDDPQSIIPPGIRLSFSVRSRISAWDHETFRWLGNGCDFEFLGTLYTIREDENVKINIPDRPPLTVYCLNIKGRGRVELRLEIDPSVKIVRK